MHSFRSPQVPYIQYSPEIWPAVVNLKVRALAVCIPGQANTWSGSVAAPTRLSCVLRFCIRFLHCISWSIVFEGSFYKQCVSQPWESCSDWCTCLDCVIESTKKISIYTGFFSHEPAKHRKPFKYFWFSHNLEKKIRLVVNFPWVEEKSSGSGSFPNEVFFSSTLWKYHSNLERKDSATTQSLENTVGT